jgi:DNA-binding transcriptional regulator YiaG|tara:strand:- start:208 stop:438 length:231 start_codon:yes stop_codon:yes gene_type:complete
MIGYTQLLATKNSEADQTNLGVQLGKICIYKKVPVQTVANYFGVSRAAVYAWFSGESKPRKSKEPEIKEFIRSLEQ